MAGIKFIWLRVPYLRDLLCFFENIMTCVYKAPFCFLLEMEASTKN
jgi:hypothetical protein